MTRKCSLGFKKNTDAQIGIGTLIIFIAMILIASIAAAVMIQTSGILQEQAAQTGRQATQEVSSNILIRNIEGYRANDTGGQGGPSDTIDMIKINAGLHVGTSEIDISQTIITVSDGSRTNTLVYAGNERIFGTTMEGFDTDHSTNLELLLNGTTNDGPNSKLFFTANPHRDEDGSFSQSDPLMSKGDLISLYVATVSRDASGYTSLYSYDDLELKSSDLKLNPRTRMSIVISSEYGPDVSARFYTPSAYGVNMIVGLYP
ncbi:archaellin/type IV pilin N-terminal domain-containing protein [Methanosalsum natronophilum]|uniref:archaellin/type IV pilin N-terminal domain-containing protein n=1 Tax=Methanosalsum natronophilum TaxID=768733 RepID=UPI00216812FC|nr:archaellin/type IV pilin N-terminal domain-containing protein [Methanosalsum natronophilum]MCS3924565.1 flagellin FlaB [Methanosalsum natronophilum]